MTRSARAVFLLPFLFGCYAYRPIDSTPAPAGEDVRVALTDSGAVLLAAQLGPSTEAVSGRVLADSAGTYVLAVRATRRRGGADTDWKGERVAGARVLGVAAGGRSRTGAGTV